MKVSIKFSLASSKSEDKPIRIRISYDGLRLDLRSGYVCPSASWDPTTMRMVPGSVNRYGERAAYVNSQLSKQETDIYNLLTRYELDGKIPEPSVLKSDFNVLQGRVMSRCTSLNFSVLYDMFISDKSTKIQSSTLSVYAMQQKAIGRYAFALKPIDDLTIADIDGYKAEMINDGMQNQTINVYLNRVKTILRWSYKKGLYHGTLHNVYSPEIKRVSKDVMYLEWSEFLAVYNLPICGNYKKIARDMFCLCCSTGLRISDCEELTWDSVTLSGNGSIHLVAKKTKKQTIIELNDYSREILERYRLMPANKDNRVFPYICIKNRVDLLRYIARAAGLNRKVRRVSVTGNHVGINYKEICDVISTHWGRHTFIVHALSLGISPAIVMSWTGHSSFESMKPYVQIASVEKANNMALFNAPKKAPGDFDSK